MGHNENELLRDVIAQLEEILDEIKKENSQEELELGRRLAFLETLGIVKYSIMSHGFDEKKYGLGYDIDKRYA